MARLNEILVGRFNRGLQKLFGIKGSPPVATLAPEIMPVHGLFNGVENRYLEGWNRVTFPLQFVAVAGQIASGRIRNPAGSGVIAVVEKALVANTGAAAAAFDLSYGVATADLVTVVSNPFNTMDPRGNPQTSLITSLNQAAAISPLAQDLVLPVLPVNGFYDYIQTENQEIPILPGNAVQLRISTLNNAANLLLCWRERFLEDSERT